MPICAVYGCFESTSSKSRRDKNQNEHQSPDQDALAAILKQLFLNAADDEAPFVGDYVMLFGFPRKEEYELKWKIAGGCDPSAYPKDARFCSKHFTKKQYDLEKLLRINFKVQGLRILLATAMPTLFLPKRNNPSNAQIERSKRHTERAKRFNSNSETPTLKRPKNDTTEGPMTQLSLIEMECGIPDEHESGETHDKGQMTAKISAMPNSIETTNLLKTLNSKAEKYLRTSKKGINESANPLSLGHEEDPEVICNLSLITKLNNVVDQLSNDIAKLKLGQSSLVMENKALKRNLSTVQKQLAEFKEERDILHKQIEDCGGAVSHKMKDKIIRETLQKYFSEAQVNRLLLKGQCHWTDTDYSNAVTLLCISSRAYKYIREKLNYPLPSVTSVKTFAANLHCVPGLMTTTLKFMEAQASFLPDLHKILVATFDEVSVNSNVCFYAKQDRILGPHKNAQVIYVRALFSTWGNELFYDFDCPVTKELVLLVSEKLYHIGGYKIVAWDSDLGPTNRGVYTALGINDENQIVPHPVTKEPMFFFSDSPHDLKNARNHLLDHSIVLNPGEKELKVASRQPLEQLVSLAPSKEFKGQQKIDWQHILCREQDRQNVLMAVQTLSNTTAEALMEAGKLGLLASPNYEATSKYGSVHNKFFDIFNVKEDLRLKGGDVENIPAYKLPFGAKYEEQKNILEEIADFVSTMRVKGRKEMIFFQHGIVWNCRALPQLYQYLKNLFPSEDILIMTYKLNQDCLEILFSVLRAAAHANTTPTPVDFSHRISKHVIMKNPTESLVSNTHNVEIDKELISLPGKVFADIAAVAATEKKRKVNSNSTEDVNTEELLLEDLGEPIESDDEAMLDTSSAQDVSFDDEDDFLDDCLSLQPTDNESLQKSHYRKGIYGLAGIIAFRLRASQPNLQSQDPHLTCLPQWLEPYSKKGQVAPSKSFCQEALKMDAIFKSIHGKNFNKAHGITELFMKTVATSKNTSHINPKVVKLFGWLRLCIRMRCINRRKNKNKDAVIEVNTKAKTDKNTRAAKKRSQWNKSKK